MRVENILLKQAGTAVMVNLFGIIAVMNHFQKFMMQTCKLESTHIHIKVFTDILELTAFCNAITLSNLHFKTIAVLFHFFFYPGAANVL